MMIWERPQWLRHYRRLLFATAIATIFHRPLSWAKEWKDENGVYQISESFTVAAPRITVWGVLTDYDGMPEFISSMRLSRVRERGNRLIVEQETSSRFLLLKRSVRVLLQVREDPQQTIRFEDISRIDFEVYSGSWSLKEVPGGVEVAYRLSAKPKFLSPKWIARGIFRNIVKSLLGELRSEILERGRQ